MWNHWWRECADISTLVKTDYAEVCVFGVFRSKFQFVKTKCQLNQTTIFQAFGAQKRRSLQRAPN